MTITLLNNKTGVIHGEDSKRINCDKQGVLAIGKTSVAISPNNNEIMPLIYHGATGVYTATFTDVLGVAYDLGRVEVHNGRISSPSPFALDLLQLKCRADFAEAEAKALREEIEKLKGIFDTNSLNFLIKGEEE